MSIVVPNGNIAKPVLSSPSQRAQIRKHLEGGGTLTAMDALNMFGCWNLKGRIWDVKKLLEPNEQIQRQWVKTESGKRVARYSLIIVNL